MKRTLFRQMITYLLMFCIVLCAAGYAVIELLFGEYYVARQKETIQQSMDELVSRYNEGDIEDIDTAIDYYDGEYGITVHFYDTLNNTLYGVSLQGQGRQGVFAAMSEENIGEFFVSTSGQGTGRGQGTEWLSYLTQTDDGNLILGRISYASMDSAVAVVQQFLLWFGVAVAAAFILFAFFFSRSMSRPLKRLNAIAFEMGELNFSMRYDEKRRDEIGQLGSTLNALTTKLENTITQLKGELSKEKTLEKMRTQFTAQVSHELQTPLSVIKGYAEALADNIYETKEAAGVYSILVNEAQKISDMVSDLLDLSQMEAGAYVIKKQTFDLAALLRRIYERYSTLPNEKAFSIHLSAEDSVSYFGDPLRIEQAVRNVLINAIKHVKSGGNIDIRLSQQAYRMFVTVENDGEPIEQGDLPHIFDSYYQGSNKKGGSGIGLAVTRHIIVLHGGEITVNNTQRGVKFEIILP